MADSVEQIYTDEDGDPADETAATRLTVKSGGHITTETLYLDDNGNPTPQSVATWHRTSIYDDDGNVAKVRREPSPRHAFADAPESDDTEWWEGRNDDDDEVVTNIPGWEGIEFVRSKAQPDDPKPEQD